MEIKQLHLYKKRDVVGLQKWYLKFVSFLTKIACTYIGWYISSLDIRVYGSIFFKSIDKKMSWDGPESVQLFFFNSVSLVFFETLTSCNVSRMWSRGLKFGESYFFTENFHIRNRRQNRWHKYVRSVVTISAGLAHVYYAYVCMQQLLRIHLKNHSRSWNIRN